MRKSIGFRTRHLQNIGALLASASILHSFSTLRSNTSPIVSDLFSVSHLNNHTQHDEWLYQDFTLIPDLYFDSREPSWSGLHGRNLKGKPAAVHVVLAFCVHSLDWFHSAFSDVNITNLTVYSKCGKGTEARDIFNRGNMSVDISVVRLPNVGRIDHTIVHDMLSRSQSTSPETVIVYIKDTFPVVHQKGLETASLHDMISKAAGPLGFGCGLQPSPQLPPSILCKKDLSVLARVLRFVKNPERCIPDLKTSCQQKLSAWHLTSELESFHLDGHTRTDGLYSKVDDEAFQTNHSFRSWLKEMRISLPYPVSLSCYGGTFAVRYEHIDKARVPLLKMHKSLSRGDNILEGHFAERTWAGLLSSQLPPELLQRVLHTSVGVLPFPHMSGCLVHCA